MSQCTPSTTIKKGETIPPPLKKTKNKQTKCGFPFGVDLWAQRLVRRDGTHMQENNPFLSGNWLGEHSEG
jgi:hypothetical protein